MSTLRPKSGVQPGDPQCWNEIGTHGEGSCPELAKFVHCRSCPIFGRAAVALFQQRPPEGYLEEWALAVAKPTSRNVAATLSAVVFRLGGEWLGLETALFVEVSEMKKARRLAHRSGTVLIGLVNIRGQLELCVSLRSLLHVQPVSLDEPHRRLLVIERDQQRWVFEADEVAGVHRYAESDVGAVPATLGAPLRGGSDSVATFTRAVLKLEDRRVALLDAEALLVALRRGVE